jgi:hypothetical protein
MTDAASLRVQATVNGHRREADVAPFATLHELLTGHLREGVHSGDRTNVQDKNGSQRSGEFQSMIWSCIACCVGKRLIS